MVNETRASLKSGNISGESQRRILTLSAILLLIACYTPSRYIEYDAQRNRMRGRRRLGLLLRELLQHAGTRKVGGPRCRDFVR